MCNVISTEAPSHPQNSCCSNDKRDDNRMLVGRRLQCSSGKIHFSIRLVLWNTFYFIIYTECVMHKGAWLYATSCWLCHFLAKPYYVAPRFRTMRKFYRTSSAKKPKRTLSGHNAYRDDRITSTFNIT